MKRTEETTALATRGPAPLPIAGMADIATAGQLLAEASFLGCRTAGEGFVVLATCHQTGMSLVEFQQKFHFRQGRFSMQAHAMLADLVERGGTYKVIERSPDRAALELSKDGNTYLSEVTWEQAQAEPFVYAGNENDQLAQLRKPVGERHLKAKYKTPRSRMQMLWARAVSDGVVVVDPGARAGIYTPEEMDDVREAGAGGDPVPIADVRVRAAEAAPSPSVMPASPSPVIDADATPFDGQAVVPDYTVCPIPGPMEGTAWAAMPVGHLQMALEIEHPLMVGGHREAIRQAIAAKEE